MPSTEAFQSPSARNESSRGTRSENVSSEPSGVPIEKIENDAGALVSYWASAAAIFIGCTSVITLACWSPLAATPSAATSSTIEAIRPEVRNASGSRSGRRTMFHSETPSTRAPAVMKAPKIVCGKVTSVTLLVSTAAKSIELGTTGHRVVLESDRVLHEGVGGEDEVRRQQRAGGRDPDGGEVQLRGEAVPPEDPQAEERRLEEEGEQTFDRERRAEDVADEA